MAFNKAKLQSDFEAVFASMTDGNEDTFPNGISAAVVTFVNLIPSVLEHATVAGSVTEGLFVASDQAKKVKPDCFGQ